MPNFEVRVRLLDIDENDAWSARRAAEERLRAAGFKRWQIVGLRLQDALPSVAPVRVRRQRRRGESGLAVGLLFFAILAWTLWFWWMPA